MPLEELLNVNQLGSVDNLLSKFPALFSAGLGMLQGVTAKITVPEGARPRFFKLRPVPFALQDLVEQELQRLQREGILVPVRTTEWAAPIVPVLKGYGRVRVCGDFKVTVNHVAEIETYPVPNVDELCGKLPGGVKFSKLDLNNAYQQVMLDTASQKFWTINTEQGLFQYSRLPFSVSSAPALSQTVMDSLLQDCQGAVVYFDDIVTRRQDG